MKMKYLFLFLALTACASANRGSIDDATILNWENGIYEPKISQLIQLADLFNVRVDYLVERKTNIDKINDICKELEKISKDEIINFVKSALTNKN